MKSDATSTGAAAKEAAPARRRGWFSGSAVRIACIYAAVSVAWIYLSDTILGLFVRDHGTLVNISVYKGLVFVVATSLLLLWLMGRALGALERSHSSLRTKSRELERQTRLYAALGQVNQAIVTTSSRDELFARVCHVLVEHGGFRLAWIGWNDPVTNRLVPVAAFGDGEDYIRGVSVYSDDRPEGRGPSGHAFRTGRPHVVNDMLTDPSTAIWREEIRRRGFLSGIAIPIRIGNTVAGTLSVYALEPGFFQDKELALLEETAGDISFGLENFARNDARRQAEALAESERRFSDTMLDSMPGILYFYDAAGRFLRWNRNFETVSGFTGAEIARMHPREFFAPEHRAALEERIAEVFIKGESSIEAPFRAKDGTTTPYYLTGRRVVFNEQPCLVGVGIDISERIRAEAALREVEERFHAFMDATPAITWITDTEGRHLFMNRAWDDAFGLDRNEWIGKTARDLVPEEAARRIRESDRTVLELDRAIEIPEDTGTLRGRPFCWNCVKFPFRNAAGERFIGGIAIDITARKQAEEERRASDARYRTLFEHAPDGIVIADNEGRYLDANASMCRMLGYTHAELVGMHASQIVVSSEAPSIAPAIAAITGRVAYQREWIFRRKDGSTFPGEVIATLMPDGKLMGMIRDVTERKQAETALRELNSSLEQKVAERTEELRGALQRAETSDRVKSAFLATMSHELRTPLNSIIGFTGIMTQGLAGPLNDEQSRQLGMVRSSARHLLDLINDVLDISKIEAGQLDVQAEPLDLPASIAHVVELTKPLAAKKGLALLSAVDSSLGEIVGDRRRLEQILLNLINNAIKFTEKGTVTLSADRIAEFRFAPDAAPAEALQFRVSDTGIGIRPEDQARLFQPFSQIETGLSRTHEGTGLGLAICRQLARLMGGEISVASEWAKGSVFTVTIPLRRRTTAR